VDILRMLEDLEELSVDKPRRFGPVTFGYNQDEVQMHISKIRASVPIELKQAANIARETERMMEQAREDAAKSIDTAKTESDRLIQEAKVEADRLREQARLEAEQMVSQNEILRLAKAQADEIRASADREAVAVRRGAEDYAYNLLNQIEAMLGKAMAVIDKGKAELRPQTAPAPDTALVQPREKDKVRV